MLNEPLRRRDHERWDPTFAEASTPALRENRGWTSRL